MRFRSMRLHFLLAVVAACGGTLPLVTPDGGDDGGFDTGIDVTTPDVIQGNEAAVDSPVADSPINEAGDVMASSDAADVGCSVPDASTPKDASLNVDAASQGWAETLGPMTFYGIDVDRQGNILLGGVSTSSGFFLQELDSTGGTTWKKTAGTSNTNASHVAWSVAFDPWGNVYAAGATTDALDVGGGAKGPGAFIVKYDSKGNFQWEYGPFPNTTFRQVRAKSTGNIVAVGTIAGSENYGGGTLNPVGTSDAVLVEVTGCMSFVRAKQWGGNGLQETYALAIDPSDNIFLGGRFESAIDFGGGTMTGPTANSGVFNLFVAKLDSSAGYLYQLQTQTTSNNSMIHSLSADPSGSVFVGGLDADSVNLGGNTLTANGNYDAFIGELDSSLGHKWSKHYGHSGDVVIANGVAADPTGGVAIAGQYNSTGLNFGQGTLPSGQGFFVAQFDSNGNSLASYGTVSTLSAVANAIAFLNWPDFAIGGYCSGTVTVRSDVLSCGGGGQTFAARLQP